jgi:hypothetical protein
MSRGTALERAGLHAWTIAVLCVPGIIALLLLVLRAFWDRLT